MQKPVETATLVRVMLGQLSAIKVQVDRLTRQQIGWQLFAVMELLVANLQTVDDDERFRHHSISSLNAEPGKAASSFAAMRSASCGVALPLHKIESPKRATTGAALCGEFSSTLNAATAETQSKRWLSVVEKNARCRAGSGAAHLSSSTLPGSSIKPFTALSASFSAASAVLVVFFGALTIG